MGALFQHTLRSPLGCLRHQDNSSSPCETLSVLLWSRGPVLAQEQTPGLGPGQEQGRGSPRPEGPRACSSFLDSERRLGSAIPGRLWFLLSPVHRAVPGPPCRRLARGPCVNPRNHVGLCLGRLETLHGRRKGDSRLHPPHSQCSTASLRPPSQISHRPASLPHSGPPLAPPYTEPSAKPLLLPAMLFSPVLISPHHPLWPGSSPSSSTKTSLARPTTMAVGYPLWVPLCPQLWGPRVS